MALLVAAHPDLIALLGARPERPETGYGYIVVGHRVVGPGEGFRVVAFHEKPAPALAARVIGRGGLWNSFVMVGRVARMLELVREVRPGDVAALEGYPQSRMRWPPRTTGSRRGTSRATSWRASHST